ncbi:hypothetical protein AHF37_09488 [Paragonimus kellicotti]|nr:hypothetical protein AHF37_09488 [Paragonimus kellicotti]
MFYPAHVPLVWVTFVRDIGVFPLLHWSLLIVPFSHVIKAVSFFVKPRVAPSHFF